MRWFLFVQMPDACWMVDDQHNLVVLDRHRGWCPVFPRYRLYVQRGRYREQYQLALQQWQRCQRRARLWLRKHAERGRLLLKRQRRLLCQALEEAKQAREDAWLLELSD